jgi:hypothetical protein
VADAKGHFTHWRRNDRVLAEEASGSQRKRYAALPPMPLPMWVLTPAAASFEGQIRH